MKTAGPFRPTAVSRRIFRDSNGFWHLGKFGQKPGSAELAEQHWGRRAINHLAGSVAIPHGHPGPAFGWVPGASPPGVWAGRTAATRQRVEAALPTQTGVPMLSARWMVRLCVLSAALPSLCKNYFT